MVICNEEAADEATDDFECLSRRAEVENCKYLTCVSSVVSGKCILSNDEGAEHLVKVESYVVSEVSE